MAEEGAELQSIPDLRGMEELSEYEGMRLSWKLLSVGIQTQ